MNLKKTIIIGLAVTAAFASFGCGDSGKHGSSSASVSSQQAKQLDEATIKSLAKQMESSKIEERKDACPIEKLPTHSFLKTPLKDESNTFINFSQPSTIKNLSVLNIKQAGEYATAQVNYIGTNNQQCNEHWIFKRLNGKWKFDPMGINSTKPLKVSASDGEQLEAAANLGYTYEDVPVLLFDVRSKTTTNYTLGQWGQPSYVLITDQGEFPVQNSGNFTAPSGFFQITSAQPFRLYIPFKGAAGKPKALRITGFNEMDSQGFPVGHDTAQVVTFSLSE